MFITLLSAITSVKDYVEIVHKLIESDPTNQLQTYYDLGAIITYIVLTAKQVFIDFISLTWLQNLWCLPTLVPNIASSMISEISVLDGYFHNAFTFLETPVSYGDQNLILYCLEKFTIGMINSVFLCLPTSITHLICFRRFVMQGIEAGYTAGLGTIAGNVLWIGSVIFGLRFLIIPWLSLDILRYLLGFILLVKYMWDSHTERRRVLEDVSKWKIFLLNFLLAFTEQTCIYPFVSNLTIGSDATVLETFPAENFAEFISIHGFYLLGICVGSFSLLQLTCWFWENPAYNLYIWMISSFKVAASAYYKSLNFVFLYITMLCAISSVAYFGLDYTLTNPLGLIHEDRLVDQKTLIETAFVNTKASDRNTRRNRGRHGRRERWKRRVRKYRTFDASLYDQGVYDLFTIEDLNYGFDRFWLRRKLRNHRVRFRFFPGPWMRSFKKQLARPRLESFMAPRVEFFRILFEQVYHPEFHEFNKGRTAGSNTLKKKLPANADGIGWKSSTSAKIFSTERFDSNKITSIYADPAEKYQTRGLVKEFSALRKFVRKVNNRVKASNITLQLNNNASQFKQTLNSELSHSVKPIYSKRWKQIFSKMSHRKKHPQLRQQENLFRRFYDRVLMKNPKTNDILSINSSENLNASSASFLSNMFSNNSKKEDIKQRLSKKDRQILRYKTFLKQNSATSTHKDSSDRNTIEESTSAQKQNRMRYEKDVHKSLTLLHPIKFYLQKEQAFRRKLKFYGVNVFRNFGIENNAAYFRIMMRRFFYYYKPTLRWERTMRTATMRRGRRKGSRIPRKMNLNKKIQGLSRFDENDDASLLNPSTSGELNLKTISPNSSSYQKPTHFYSLVNKRASRYRYQIYKDVLQHWYYTPFNRLLVKLDVDSFIRRQPSSHFLTKKEEGLLHLRRFLLSDYYETLRWYTYMQHYDSMKTRIGGTKSFANRAYNQQFMGTLKKVRHLFAITPSSTENTILKFDQPLYNEFPNDKENSILNESLIHEELLADDFIYDTKNTNEGFFGDDLKNQSALVIREYLSNAKPIREKFIKKLLSEKNYWELTKFLFKGQKIRGTNAVTNERSFVAQEKQLLFTPEEKQTFDENQRQQLKRFFSQKIDKISNNDDFSNMSASSMEETIWLALIKRCQNQLYNQEALKLYLSRHIDKLNRQRQTQQKSIENRLERMKNWLHTQNSSIKNEQPTKKSNESLSPDLELEEISKNTAGLTTAVQKAIKEAVFFQKGWNPVKMNIRNNRPQINWAVIDSRLNENTSRNLEKSVLISGNFRKSTNLKNHLKIRMKLHQLQINRIENDLRKSIASVRSDQNESKKIDKPFYDQNHEAETQQVSRTPSKKSFGLRLQNISYLLKTTITPFKKIYKSTFNPIASKSIDVTNRLFRSNAEDDLDVWKKQETISNRRKKTRKTLKKLKHKNVNSQKPRFSTGRDLLRYNIQKNTDDLLREKRDALNSQSTSWIESENKRHIKSWKQWREKFNASSFVDESRSETQKTQSAENKNVKANPFNLLRRFFPFDQIFTKKFKRKRSRVRRSRRLRARGTIKKRTMGDRLKRQFKLLKRYARNEDDPLVLEKLERKHKKLEIFEMITKRTYQPESPFQIKETKQRRTRQRKNRFWKKHKKPKYAQNRRKQRKRRRFATSKIRSLNKQLKRIKSNLSVKRWWWQSFLPNFQASADAVWQIENDAQTRQKLSKLSLADILERDRSAATNFLEKTLQIGDKDYKPLAIPEALRIRENLIQDELLSFGDSRVALDRSNANSPVNAVFDSKKPTQTNENESSYSKQPFISKDGRVIDTLEKLDENNPEMGSADNPKNTDFDIIGQISRNSLISNTNHKKSEEIAASTKKVLGMNPIPFYAGWDESLRKFVVTNRLLSNKQAGYAMNVNGELDGSPVFSLGDEDAKIDLLSDQKSNSRVNDSTDYERVNQSALSKLFKALNSTRLQFSAAPLEGMNAATTLYCQVPFTAYDPDQFFSLGMDGFAPIGWRRFHFRHSKQTIKPILVKTKTIGSFDYRRKANQDVSLESNKMYDLSYNIQMKIFENRFKSKSEVISKRHALRKNISRRTQKRYKRVKKHPRPPVWFPSGPLVNEVLPVHYIYVFYKRARLPRDRYVRRRLRRNKKGVPSSIRSSLTRVTDMTLRRRSKPRRKYHRKPRQSASLRASKIGVTSLKRRPFRGFPREAERSRPVPETRENRLNEQSTLKSSASKRRKTSMTKQQSESSRIRQLRRRVQRQVIRSIWRYKPRIGGFVWPGDYLRLEQIRVPKLNPNTQREKNTQIDKNDESTRSNKQRKIRKKKKRIIQEWQIQPKKYLLQKHNLQVLKKRLQKSQNTNKIHQRVKELTYFFKNKSN